MIKVALIGTGGMGTVHLSNYTHVEGCQVVALIDTADKAKELEEKWKLPVYESIPEMVEHEQVDLVDVCTPTFLHKTHVMQALQRGMHVITEKPVALSRSDADEMFALADKMGKQLFVAQVLQFTKESEILHELVKNETFGKPLDAHFERLSAAPTWATGGWLFDKTKSGLLPFDLHIHDLDIIVSLFGKPTNFDFTSCAGTDKAYKEHYRFIYHYNDLNVVAEAAWFNANFPFTARWRVYFENAVVVNDGTQLIAYPVGQEAIVYDTEEKLKIPTGINLPPTGMFHHELTHFIQCIQKGIPSERVSREQVLTVVNILEQISSHSSADTTN